jgi:hypothetical protein
LHRTYEIVNLIDYLIQAIRERFKIVNKVY